MHERLRRLRFAVVLGVVMLLAGCGGPEPLQLAEISVDCSALRDDPQLLVGSQEMAFDGTVVDTSLERNVDAGFQRGLIDDGRILGDEALDSDELQSLDAEISRHDSGEEVSVGEIWPWTTFDVHDWYTHDNGGEISIWTAGLDLEVGDRWLIAGQTFATPAGLGDHFDRSGMSAVCASRKYSEAAAAEWEAWFGGNVTPGSDTPENEPIPEVVEEVESRRRAWKQLGLDDYTFSGYRYVGDEPTPTGCPTNGRLRIVVEDGRISQAVNMTETCAIPTDNSGLWTIDDMFDMAALVSGTDDWNIEWTEERSYPRSVYGYDRSFEAELSVARFVSKPVPGYFGSDLAEALEQNRALWESRSAEDYTITIDIDCFCPPERLLPVTVMVNRGEVVKAIREGVDIDPSRIDFGPMTIEELFDFADHPTNNVVVGFDPEYGFPTDIYDEGERNTIDDEIAYHISGFEAAPIDLSEPRPQPPSDPSAAASEITEEWQEEIRVLRESAGPGKLVGFVNLGGDTSTGFPLADTQPFCTGTKTFADVAPGAAVVAFGENGDIAGRGVLRGSAFDAHSGCILWFGVDIEGHDAYRLMVGSHETEFIESSELADGGWIVKLWSSPASMEANCEMIPDPFNNCLHLQAGD